MWEVSLIEALQSLSGGFLDWVFYIITFLGEELVFIAIAAVLFWCFDKKFGYKFMNVYFFGAAAVEGLKAIFRIPRPYDSPTGRIKSIFGKTEGYSFPSGHSHSISNICTQLSLRYGRERRVLYIVCPIIVALVMLSRMYLGQHYLSDVLAGAAFGFAAAYGFSKLFDLLGDKEEYLCFVLAPLLILLSFLVDSENIKTLGGAYCAVSIGYFIEKRFIKYEVKARLVVQLLKIAVGLGIAFGIKEGMKLILPEEIPTLYDFLRYFILGAWAAVGAPAVFKYFPHLVGKIRNQRGETPQG